VKVQDRAAQVARLGARVIFVSFDEPATLRRTLLRGIELEDPLLIDRRRESYRVWGLRRSSVARVWLDPRVWWRYGVLLLSGERLRGVGVDTLQLGGDFVIDRGGRVSWARPQTRDDRPPIAVVMRELERAAL
jgi:peroxiredoxin